MNRYDDLRQEYWQAHGFVTERDLELILQVFDRMARTILEEERRVGLTPIDREAFHVEVGEDGESLESTFGLVFAASGSRLTPDLTVPIRVRFSNDEIGPYFEIAADTDESDHPSQAIRKGFPLEPDDLEPSLEDFVQNLSISLKSSLEETQPPEGQWSISRRDDPSS